MALDQCPDGDPVGINLVWGGNSSTRQGHCGRTISNTQRQSSFGTQPIGNAHDETSQGAVTGANSRQWRYRWRGSQPHPIVSHQHGAGGPSGDERHGEAAFDQLSGGNNDRLIVTGQGFRL